MNNETPTALQTAGSTPNDFKVVVIVDNSTTNAPVTLAFGDEQGTSWTNTSPQTVGANEQRTFIAYHSGVGGSSIDASITLREPEGQDASAISLHCPLSMGQYNAVTKTNAGFPLDLEIGDFTRVGSLIVTLNPQTIGSPASFGAARTTDTSLLTGARQPSTGLSGTSAAAGSSSRNSANPAQMIDAGGPITSGGARN